MEKLTTLAFILVSLSILSGVLSFLLPSKNTEKIMRIILSSVVLLTVFTSVKGISFADFELSESQKSEISGKSKEIEEKIDRYVLEISEKELNSVLNSQLEKNNIFPENIEVLMDRNEDNSIYIKEINITLAEKQKYLKKAVETLVTSQLGSDIKINIG